MIGSLRGTCSPVLHAALLIVREFSSEIIHLTSLTTRTPFCFFPSVLGSRFFFRHLTWYIQPANCCGRRRLDFDFWEPSFREVLIRRQSLTLRANSTQKFRLTERTWPRDIWSLWWLVFPWTLEIIDSLRNTPDRSKWEMVLRSENDYWFRKKDIRGSFKRAEGYRTKFRLSQRYCRSVGELHHCTVSTCVDLQIIIPFRVATYTKISEHSADLKNSCKEFGICNRFWWPCSKMFQ